MSDPEQDGEITLLLRASAVGSNDALTQLYGAVEGELRKLATGLHANHNADHTLQTTVLINEAFVRLTMLSDREWDDRSMFFRIASGTMRNILADHARRRRPATFADGSLPQIADSRSPGPTQNIEHGELLSAMAHALEELDTVDPEAAAAFLFCFFGAVEQGAGLTTEQLSSFSGDRKPLAEIANVRGLSVTSVHRNLSRALGFLQNRLETHR